MESGGAGSSEASESVTITLRIDPRMLARIKRLARSRYLNYQSMIKQWLSERMEQELRERQTDLTHEQFNSSSASSRESLHAYRTAGRHRCHRSSTFPHFS